MRPLTEDHKKILAFLARHDATVGAQYAQWIAEACGHAYDTPWATHRMNTLAHYGLVEHLESKAWRITDAGRAALATAKDDTP